MGRRFLDGVLQYNYRAEWKIQKLIFFLWSPEPDNCIFHGLVK